MTSANSASDRHTCCRKPAGARGSPRTWTLLARGEVCGLRWKVLSLLQLYEADPAQVQRRHSSLAAHLLLLRLPRSGRAAVSPALCRLPEKGKSGWSRRSWGSFGWIWPRRKTSSGKRAQSGGRKRGVLGSQSSGPSVVTGDTLPAEQSRRYVSPRALGAKSMSVRSQMRARDAGSGDVFH